MKIVFVILILSFYFIYARLPGSITELQKSMCLVEYFQPQYERGEIKDQSRIKRTITGILVGSGGLVLTSDEIFPANIDTEKEEKPPEDITVSFNREQKLKANFVGKDQELHLAFIQIIDKKNLPPPVVFDTTISPGVGESIYLLEHLDRRFNYEPLVQEANINAVLKNPFKKWVTNSGVSVLSAGGLVLNHAGNAVGVTFNGDGFFNHEFQFDDRTTSEIKELLPVELFFSLIKNPPQLELQAAGSGKSWLGIRMQMMNNDMAAYWGLDSVHGIIVNSIVPKSPAEKCGLQVGDIITQIEKFKVKDEEKSTLDIFRNYIRSIPDGPHPIYFYRDGKMNKLSVTLESAPKSLFMADEYFNEVLGLRVKEITQDIILSDNLDFDIEGVWVSRVEEAGPAGLSGLSVGDIIVEVNEQYVKNLKQFKNRTEKVLSRKPDYVELFIMRDGKTQFIFIRVADTAGA